MSCWAHLRPTLEPLKKNFIIPDFIVPKGHNCRDIIFGILAAVLALAGCRPASDVAFEPPAQHFPSPTVSDEQIRWDLRRAATNEVRTMGITHLLVQDGQYGADDFRKRSASWGLALLGEAGGYRLYSIL